MDREEQRKNRRQEENCKDSFKAPSRVYPGPRDGKDCDSIPSPPNPDEFYGPNRKAQTATTPTGVPQPLDIPSDAHTATCLDLGGGSVGDDVTALAGAFIESFYFQDVPNISDEQLTFISTLDDATRLVLADPTTPISVVVNLTGLTTAQATYVSTEVNTLKSAANAAAELYAQSQLDCVWGNVVTTVNCDTVDLGAYTNDTVPAGQANNVNNPVTVAANTYTSAISQSDANEQAEQAAEAARVCLWGNDEVTVYCTDADAGGFTEAVPVDTVAVSLDGRMRIGQVTVAADSTYSAIDKDTATSIARAIALAQLDCFYVNAAAVVTCDDVGKVGATTAPVSAATYLEGNPVNIPAGLITSVVDTADANAQANTLGLSLLLCYWENDRVYKECPPIDYVNYEGDAIELRPKAAPVSANFSTVVAAGEVRSYTSKADANAQAEIIALAALDCTYCNEEVLPVCIPDFYTISNVPIPLGDYDSNTWAVDATRGVAADTFCCDAADCSQGIADTFGSVTLSSQSLGLDCTYTNREVVVTCPTGTIGTNGVRCTGGDCNTVTITAGLLSVSESQVGPGEAPQDVVDQLAQELAVAMLNCYWENTTQNAGCPANGHFYPGSIPSASVPAYTVTSFRSQAEADTLALAVAQASLFCVYGSDPVTGGGGGCGPGEVEISQGSFGINAFSSAISTGDATALAQTLADQMSICLDPDDIPGLGSPGDTGAPGTCDGTCYGYYS